MKKLLFVCILLVVVVIAGCSGQPTTDPKDNKGVDNPPGTTGPLNSPFLGGPSATSLSFIGGMPPQYVFDASGFEFGVGVRIINTGEASMDHTKSYVQIIGINPTDFSTTTANLKQYISRDLRGAKKNFDGNRLPGDEDYVNFLGLNYKPDLKGNTGFTIRANYCYVYKTYATGNICIKRDLLDNLDDVRVCKVNEEKKIFNSAGPVQVVKLEEYPMGTDKIQLKFNIKHIGERLDKIFSKDTTECNDVITNTERNKIYVKVTSDINGRKPRCQGLQNPSPDQSEGFVTLWDDSSGTPQEAPVTCILDVHDQETIFEDLFEIELEYRYQQAISTPLEIRDVSTNRP
ncbi:hypothetical protein HZB01_05565 [Candidatus Woesearchaeota archaeon]|nr:hypothetical protein [Candidatus Woesearchaeota archaeon]